MEEMKLSIAHTLEQHHKATPGDPDRVLVIFDFTGAGLTNMVSDTKHPLEQNSVERKFLLTAENVLH